MKPGYGNMENYGINVEDKTGFPKGRYCYKDYHIPNDEEILACIDFAKGHKYGIELLFKTKLKEKGPSSLCAVIIYSHSTINSVKKRIRKECKIDIK